MPLKKDFQGDVVNWLILLTLLLQIFLIATLTRKITNLENLFAAPTPGIVERVPDEQGYILGPVNAPVTIVEFADFQCPYCGSAEPILKRIISRYPDKIRFVYRHFPLTSIHPYALQAAEASECAHEQGKFWEMHDLLFSQQQDFSKTNFSAEEFFPGLADGIGIDKSEFSDCLRNQTFNEHVTKDLSDGLRYGVNATPTFFVNQQKITGISSLETTIIKAIEETAK